MTDREKVDLTLLVNGRNHEVSVEPRKTLADALREDCGLISAVNTAFAGPVPSWQTANRFARVFSSLSSVRP